MRATLSTLILALSLFGPERVWGQQSLNLPPEQLYEKATIGLSNFDKLDVLQLVVRRDSISFYHKGEFTQMDYNTVNYIKIRKGGKGKGGAMIGGSTMLLYSLLSIIQVQSDPDMELRSNAGAMIALFTAGGVALGGLIGSAIPRYKTYYIHMDKER